MTSSKMNLSSPLGIAFVALSLCISIGSVNLSASPSVSNVSTQSVEATMEIEITYDLAHVGDLLCTISAEASIDGFTWNALENVSGDVGAGIAPGVGKVILWNAGQEWFEDLFPEVSIRVLANDDNEVPVANAGADIEVTDTDDDGSEVVTLDGGDSTDSDGTVAS
ncbi:MAG: hypothetical protein DRP71_15105, partial [Verrucomicrobia bacterium]